jgi:hypothetical protein
MDKKQKQYAKIRLEHGIEFPYDANDRGKARAPKDWAVVAARGVLSNLSDRGGIKHELGAVERPIRKEIVDNLAYTIRLAHKMGRRDG